MSKPVICPVLVSLLLTAVRCLAAGGELEIRAIDKDSGKPIAVRMHIKDAKGKPVKPPKVTYWNDHFVFAGKTVLKLPVGQYTFEMEHGPEYRLRTGNFSIDRGAADNKEVDMPRFVDMKREGWWSGELHVHRPPSEIELHMLAEDLHVAPVITWWNDKNIYDGKKAPQKTLVRFDENRYYHLLAGEDEREGGALLYFNLNEPLAITGSTREYPSPVQFLREAKKQPGVHVDIEKPFWWDVPVWVATGLCDSIGLANNHLHRDGVYPGEAWGKPRDKSLLPDPQGNGRWSQEIYFQLLNCGLRIPPSAGSASGVLANPVGYNRVYVYCAQEFTYEKWWEGLRAGKVLITNGPMLRPRVNGEVPGHVFASQDGAPVSLDVELNLSLRDEVDYLEIIKDGRSIHEVRLDKWAAAGGKLPVVEFKESGWLMVRAVATNPKTFRFACSGPYYVEIGGKPKISKKSAQFFLDWVVERAKRIKLDDEKQRAEVLAPHREARDYWQKMVERANAD